MVKIISYFFQGGPFKGTMSEEEMSRFTFDGKTRLTISGVTLQDGGSYSCEISPTDEVGEAALVVAGIFHQS